MDASELDQKRIEAIPGVLGAVPQAGNRYQIVMGGAVQSTYSDIMALPEMSGGTGASGDFLRFETLTLCPIDTRCLLPKLLAKEEVEWLNGYHANVRERLAPLLKGDALAWLQVRTEPL